MELLLGMAAALWVAYQLGKSQAPAYPDLRKRAAELEAEIEGWRGDWQATRASLTVIHKRERLMREAQLGDTGLGEADSYESHVAGTQGAVQRLLTDSEKVLRGERELD